MKFWLISDFVISKKNKKQKEKKTKGKKTHKKTKKSRICHASVTHQSFWITPQSRGIISSRIHSYIGRMFVRPFSSGSGRGVVLTSVICGGSRGRSGAVEEAVVAIGVALMAMGEAVVARGETVVPTEEAFVCASCSA